ncbi:MAG: zinc ribbon domain-containing protein [Clostridia bacterium]|nr:zinc ribbon domain-containing protein [Clostridia bacterium]
MKYCVNCGQSLEDNETYCKNCGKPCNAAVNSEDTGNAGWGVLGFLFPVVGLILFLIWRDEQPKNSKSAGTGALISVIFSAIVTVIVMVIFFGALLVGMSA